MPRKAFKDKHYTTLEQVREHYQIEKELASKLRHSTKQERETLYTAVYDELYQRLPNNSIVDRKSSPNVIAWVVGQRLHLISHFLKPNTVFLEIGPDDCSLCFEVAKQAQKVYAVDVTNVFKDDVNVPENFELVISDGSSIPVSENSINIIYSHQVMEYLHPDDAIDQLQDIYRALAPGGIYICITPNRLSGPHDISHHFDKVATGLHLKEYTVTELHQLFRATGFSRTHYYKSYQNNHFAVPLIPPTTFGLKAIERLLEMLPHALRKEIAGKPLLFRGMTIVAMKQNP